MDTMKKACFFDRDGVLIEEKNYISNPDDVILSDGAADAVRRMKKAGYLVIVISNQSGIARGYFTPEDLACVEKRMNDLLAAEGVTIDGYYYCYHHPKGCVKEYAIDCDCRKPKPGMILQAARDFGIDTAQSFMIGDKVDDLRAGFNAGCRMAALVRTGHGSEQDLGEFSGKVIDAAGLSAVIDQLLAL